MILLEDCATITLFLLGLGSIKGLLQWLGDIAMLHVTVINMVVASCE